jgi:predicted nucleic acid-binding protein
MLIYLDSNIVIYLIEQPLGWGPRAAAKLAIAHANGDQLVVSDITRLECRIGPLISGDPALLARFDAYFSAPDIQVVPVSGAVCDRAAVIRASYHYNLGDALNLAAAVENHCSTFLTNDARLAGFPDISVEILP